LQSCFFGMLIAYYCQMPEEQIMKRSIVTCLAVIGISLLLVPIASATTITFNTVTGATESGGNAVKASATFTTSNGVLTIELSNQLVNPKTVAQNISGLSFVLSSGQTTGSLSSSSGEQLNVASDGSYSLGSEVSTGWNLSSISGGMKLNGLGATYTPAYTIIGLPDPGTDKYSDANGSIAGAPSHNPFLMSGPVEFVISIAGLTSTDTVRSATFFFGTTEGNSVPGTPPTNTPPIPEPTSLFLLGSGLAGLALILRKKY